MALDGNGGEFSPSLAARSNSGSVSVIDLSLTFWS
jgi:hypothetical protein